MQTFEPFNLTPELYQSIKALGFSQPTPVQEAVIPLLLEGRRNVIALAQTGTGKTAAFGIPILQRMDTDSRDIQTVILCPTRELCLQVCRDLKQLSAHSKSIRSVAIYGGASIENQRRALKNGVHIVVATPGRLHDLLRRQWIELSTVSCVVLDEADEMLSMGFEEDLKAIMSAIPDTVQKLLFSATMPRQVENLSRTTMEDPQLITIGNRNAGAEQVSHQAYAVPERHRYTALRRILDAMPSVYGIIFCRTRAETQETANLLTKDGYAANALHGDLSQAQRDQVMQTFRARHQGVLVATDVAARGLDINNLSHVINYQLPDDLESYTHRSGRTGRAGKSGVSIVLVNQRELWKLKHIEKRLGKHFAMMKIPTSHDIMHARVSIFLQNLKNMDSDTSAVNVCLPQALVLLEELSKEELIRKLMVYELSKIDMKMNEADINIDLAPPSKRSRPRRARVESGLNRGPKGAKAQKQAKLTKSDSPSSPRPPRARPPSKRRPSTSPHTPPWASGIKKRKKKTSS